MSLLPEQLQRSFLERFGRLTRSATSLRSRIRDGFAGPTLAERDTQREDAAKPVEPLTRVSRAPDGQCIYAIGDIHGRFDLLEQLIEQIEADVVNLPDDTVVSIVFLGDYIDRGLRSREVIDYFLSDRLDKFHTVYLMGYHEEALLRFLHDASFGAQWARYGGGETLFSYGFQPPNKRGTLNSHDEMATATDAWTMLWNEFRAKLPKEHLEFYQSLATYYEAGDYLFVHAGLRPGIELEQQTVRDMLWIREEFLDDDEHFPHVIVHGHTPQEEIQRDNRRIGLDTGAFLSGRLSAAKLFEDQVDFLTT